MACAALAALALTAVSQGAVDVPVPHIAAMAGHALGMTDPQFSPQEWTIVVQLRLPRVIAALLIGASLGVAGAVLQGLFRNPLADPQLIGISGGAALGAAAVILFGSGLPFLSAAQLPWLQPLAAFAGAAIAVWFIYRLATTAGLTSIATLLLAGIAINTFSGAALGLFVTVSEPHQLKDFSFWALGSLAHIDHQLLWVVAPMVTLPLLLLLRLGDALDALLLGEAEAAFLGIDVESVKRRTILLVAMAVGAGVALAGVIGFLGLMVPHLVRLLVGTSHRLLLPASACLGAAMLVAADLIARTASAPLELPVGIFTAAVGTPFFVWLLKRRPHG